ncbi:hypothetical protein, partial [Streptomyces calidiresistens]|uniref:hypothetical protein n=1 Tax=Streptomyces calidiresistens TaxID=1485586 RepID=UPI001E2A1B96
LDAWAASPARFREDTNAEEDLARGGYRDRVVLVMPVPAPATRRFSAPPERVPCRSGASRGSVPGRTAPAPGGTGPDPGRSRPVLSPA